MLPSEPGYQATRPLTPEEEAALLAEEHATQARRAADTANTLMMKRRRRGSSRSRSRYPGFPFAMSREAFRAILNASIDAAFADAGMSRTRRRQP